MPHTVGHNPNQARGVSSGGVAWSCTRELYKDPMLHPVPSFCFRTGCKSFSVVHHLGWWWTGYDCRSVGSG